MDRGFLLVVECKGKKCEKNGRFKYPLKQPHEFFHLFLVESGVCQSFTALILPVLSLGFALLAGLRREFFRALIDCFTQGFACFEVRDALFGNRHALA